MKRKFILASILTLILVAVLRLSMSLTDNFWVSAISSNSSYDPRWDIGKLSDSKRDELEKIFSKPFNYLGKGTQSFAFISQDGKYVLKFFKQKHLRPTITLQIPLPNSSWEAYRHRKIKLRQNKKDKIFSGYILAYKKIPDAAGLIYVHLNRTDDLGLTVQIRNKIGFPSTLVLDNYDFVLQKKMDTIAELLPKQTPSGFKEILQKLAFSMAEVYRKGINDLDNNLVYNYGLLDGEIKILDLGNLSYDPNIQDPEIHKPLIINRMQYIGRWLEKAVPEKIPVFNEHMNTICGE